MVFNVRSEKRNFRALRLSSTFRREGGGYTPICVVWCKPSLDFFEKKFFWVSFFVDFFHLCFFRVLGCFLSFAWDCFFIFLFASGCSFCRIFVFLRCVVCGVFFCLFCVFFSCVLRMFFDVSDEVLCVYVCKFCCILWLFCVLDLGYILCLDLCENCVEIYVENLVEKYMILGKFSCIWQLNSCRKLFFWHI